MDNETDRGRDAIRLGAVRLKGSISHQIALALAGHQTSPVLVPPYGIVACLHCGRWCYETALEAERWVLASLQGSSPWKNRVCPDCQGGMVEPLTIVVDAWGDAMDDETPWYPGLEAYAAQFAGANTTFLVFPPEATHGKLQLPEHGIGSIDYAGADAIIYRIDDL